MTFTADFATAIGRCGIAWSDRGVIGVQLPEASEMATRGRLRRRFPDASEASPTPSIQSAIDGIVALLAGQDAGDLSDIDLDLRAVPAFNAAVYRVARIFGP